MLASVALPCPNARRATTVRVAAAAVAASAALAAACSVASFAAVRRASSMPARICQFYLIAAACATAHTVAGGVAAVEVTYNMTDHESAHAPLRIADERALPPDVRAMPACQPR